MERLKRFELSTSTLARLAGTVASALPGKDLRSPAPAASHMLPKDGGAQVVLDHFGHLLLATLNALGPDVLRSLADALEVEVRPVNEPVPPDSPTATDR